MNASSNDQRADKPSMKDTFHVLYFAALVLAACFTPILRRDQGREHYRLNGIFALLFMLSYGCLECPLVLLYMVLIWLPFLIANRIRTFRNERRGFYVHSRYGGVPYLAMLVARDENRGRNLEAVCCFFFSIPVFAFIPYLGLFFFLGAVGLGVVASIEQMAERRRVMHMRDAAFENQWVAELYRQEGGDR